MSQDAALKADAIAVLKNVEPFHSSTLAVAFLEELIKHPEGLKWNALAGLVFGKTALKSKSSSSFRSLLYRVRKWLDDAYSDPSSPLQQFPRIEIKEDDRRYYFRFADGTRRCLTAFWKPYLLSESGEPQIQTADRFFLRLGDHFYFRDIRSPDSPNWTDLLEPLCGAFGKPRGPFAGPALAELQKDMLSLFSSRIAAFLSNSSSWESGESPGEVEKEQVLSTLLAKFSPDVSRHYVSAGEAVALTYIAELFQSFNKRVIFGNRMEISPDTGSANIVQVGKPGTGELLSEILNSRRFRISNDRIEDSENNGGQSLHDHLRTHADDLSGGDDADRIKADRIKYALITRCPHPRSKHPVTESKTLITSIVGSHGRVTEAACRYLTAEDSLAQLFSQLKWDAGSVLPASFQFVLRAKVSYGKGSNRTTATILGAVPEWYDIT